MIAPADVSQLAPLSTDAAQAALIKFNLDTHAFVAKARVRARFFVADTGFPYSDLAEEAAAWLAVSAFAAELAPGLERLGLDLESFPPFQEDPIYQKYERVLGARPYGKAWGALKADVREAARRGVQEAARELAAAGSPAGNKHSHSQPRSAD